MTQPTTPPRNVRTRSFTLRLADPDAPRVDAHLERMRAKNPRLQVSPADALRDLVLRGLDDAERTR